MQRNPYAADRRQFQSLGHESLASSRNQQPMWGLGTTTPEMQWRLCSHNCPVLDFFGWVFFMTTPAAGQRSSAVSIHRNTAGASTRMTAGMMAPFKRSGHRNTSTASTSKGCSSEPEIIDNYSKELRDRATTSWATVRDTKSIPCLQGRVVGKWSRR